MARIRSLNVCKASRRRSTSRGLENYALAGLDLNQFKHLLRIVGD
ncbi:hypothetical protein ACVBEG_27050 [Pseudomonas sp. GG8]